MKRPLCTAAAAWMLGELFAEDRKYLPIIILFFLCIVFVKRQFLKRKVYFFIETAVFIIFLISGTYAVSKLNLKYTEYASMAEDECLLAEGKVTLVTEKENGCQVLLAVSKAVLSESGRTMPGGVNLLLEFGEQPEIKTGNKILAKGDKKDFYVSRNEGNFDEKEYYYSQKTAVKLTVKDYKVLDNSSSEITEELHRLRRLLCRNIDQSCKEEEASVLKAVIYGDRQELDGGTKRLYVKNGIAHILAVSGLHMSIIGLGVYRLLRKKFTFFNSCMLAGALICCFGIMTGFGISVKRAVYMMGLRMTADLFGRKYDFKSAVSFSILLILTENPYAIYSASFLFSYSSMLSLGFIYPELLLWLKEKKWYNRYLMTALSGFLLWIVNLPVTAYFYFEIPTYSVFLNFLVLPLMSILFLSGMAASFFMLVSYRLGVFVSGAGVFCVKIYHFLCSRTEQLPYASIVTGRPDGGKLILFYALVLLMLVVIRCYKGKSLKKFLILICFFAAESAVIYKNLPERSLNISMIDVGQGDCILVENQNGNTYLIDAGSSSVKNAAEYRIIPYLKCQGIGYINYMLVSHGDSDHINGILEILQGNEIRIETLVLPDCGQFQEEYAELVLLARQKGTAVMYVRKGNSLKDCGLCFEIINPSDKQYSDINDSSMVMRMTYQEFSMYFTGDIGEKTEKEVLSEVCHADVIKVAHHGSDNSSSQEFLEKINPCQAIISCGEHNVYGHPGLETLERYNALNTDIFVTADCGCIRIEIPKKDAGKIYYISTFLMDKKR